MIEDGATPSWQAGVSRLIGARALNKLKNSQVAVVGLGGVGSWAAEALVRSGVGSLILVDMDEVCASNINRQASALMSTVGRPKIEVLKERFLDINPELKITLLHDFFTPTNAQDLLPHHLSAVIDCIDGLAPKCALTAFCRDHKIPLVVTGGAGGIVSPTQLKISDLAHAQRDPLLYRMRKKLRNDHAFPLGKNKSRGPAFGVRAVYADADRVYPDGDGEICLAPPQNLEGHKLDCYAGLGSVMYVTASFGMWAAWACVDLLINSPLLPVAPESPEHAP